MKKFIRIAAVTATFAGFALPGVVGAQSISYKPPVHQQQAGVEVDNDTELGLRNFTSQEAVSGDVSVGGDGQKVSLLNSRHHDDRRDRNATTVGNVTTGSVSNTNETKVDVSVASDTSVATPTNNNNEHDFRRHENSQNNVAPVSVENDADVNICNSAMQTAVSGSVSINGAGTVGDITTGDASNSNSTELVVSVSNDTAVN